MPKIEDVCLPNVGAIFALNSDSDVKSSGSVNVMGNAYLYAGAAFTLTGNTNFIGDIYKDASSSVELKGGLKANIIDMSAGSKELALRDTVYKLVAAAEALPPTIIEGETVSSSIQYSASPISPVNVISMKNLALGSSDSILLRGDSGSVFLIKVSGTAHFGSGILLSGVLPKNVLIYITDSDSAEAVSIGGTSGVSGTFLVPNRSVNFTGQGSFQGSIISGSNASPAISVGGNSGGSATDFVGDAFCITR